MKKFLLFICMYLLILSIPIDAHNECVSYRLYMDSKKYDVYEVKEDILNVYDRLCNGVSEDTCLPIVIKKKEMFKITRDTKVKIKKNILIIKVGDGKGDCIKGDFRKGNVCFEEVKPKSKIKEWFSF